MLPDKTPAQSRVVIVAAMAILLVFGTLLARLARLARQRRRVRTEWRARQAPPPEEPLE
jgi:hypothetical protein